jgi:hypothetical protein
MGRRLSRVEERVRSPHFVYVLDAQRGVLEQIRRLVVDLEWIVLIEKVEIQRLSHTPALYYNRIPRVALGVSDIQGTVGLDPCHGPALAETRHRYR